MKRAGEIGERNGSSGVSPGSTYEEAFELGQQALRRLGNKGYNSSREDYIDTSYYTESQSTDSEALNVYPTELQSRPPRSRRGVHIHRREMSAQTQTALLIQERDAILKERDRFRDIQRYYIEEITKSVAEQQNYVAHSPEFQSVQDIITDIMQQMYSKVGTPEDCKHMEKEWHHRLQEINKKLQAFQEAHINHSSSPESQMSGSNQWSPLQDQVSSYTESSSLTSEQIQRHSLNTDRYDNASQSTGSSGNRKEMSPYSLSDHGGHFLMDKPYLPHTSSSISGEEPLSQSMNAADVLQLVHDPPRIMIPQHRSSSATHNRPHNLQFQFSQESDYTGQYGSSSSTSLPYSQSSSHSGYHRSYHNGIYKPSSPSSSDNASVASSVQHRLGSGPASQASYSSISLSQSTSSSRGGSGYVYRLPRPSLPGSNPGSATNLVHSRYYQHPTSNREFGETGPYPNHPMSRRPSSHSSHSSHSRQGDLVETRRKDGKGERDSVNSAVVIAIMESVTSSQSEAESIKLLLKFSESRDNCMALRQYKCINLILKVLHNMELKGTKEHAEIRAKAAEALHNIVEANPITQQRRSERQVLRELEKVREHSNILFEFISSFRHQEPINSDHVQALQKSCTNISSVLRKIFKFSNDKELHRPAILTLGGLQAMAEVLIVDDLLPTSQDNKKIVGHSVDAIAITITILINLTYGDTNNKQFLCGFSDFLPALMHHLSTMDEQILSKGSQVLRNLSCKATQEIKDGLLKCNAAGVLMEAVEYANGETTTQHITGALWNISAHSNEVRHRLCTIGNGIETLVGLLSYNSPSGATVVIENVGGVLKNLSSVISQEEEYRRRFREAGGLAKLVQHLKSKNRTVLANATGILWNLSARCPENQKLLWDLGSIPLLDVLQSSKERNIAENARGALRNLLAFGHSNGWTSLATPPSSRSRRSHSTVHSSAHSLSQSYNGNEFDGMSGRRSAPYVNSGNMSAHNSTSSLRCTSEHEKRRGHQLVRMDKVSPKSTQSHVLIPHPPQGDLEYYNKHPTPRFTRVLSAPQSNEDREEEWMNYRPVAKHDSPEMGQKYAHIPSNGPAHHSRTKKKSSPSRHQQLKIPSAQYSCSQTESVESEFQSISAASIGLSPQLPTEILGGNGMKQSTYQDLDSEIHEEENEAESSHLRHPSEGGSETSEHFSIAEQFAQNRGSIRKSEYIPPSISQTKSSPILLHNKMSGFDSPRLHGTSGLALDGTTPDGLEPISENSDRNNSFSVHQEGLRSHSSSFSSSTSKDASTDI